MQNAAAHIALQMASVLRKCVAVLVIIFFTYMTVAVLIQVFGRYVFNYSIGWASETATFSQIWMVLLAAGLAMRQNMHVGVDALAQQLPLPVRRILIVIISAAALWFLFQAVWGSRQLIKIGQIQTSPAVGLPMWIPYLSLPLGMSYFAFEVVAAFLSKWKNPDGDTADAEKGVS